MAVAMVIMESPAIIMAVLLANAIRHSNPGFSPALPTQSVGAAVAPAMTGSAAPLSLSKILRESFTDGAHLLLLGSMAVGYISGEAGKTMMQPFSGDLFKGMLAFFLLDMGLLTARNLPQVRRQSPWLIGYALLAPLVHASLALALAWALGIATGDATLLMVLAASASYIAVPAVLRHAIPEAQPALYFGMSLGVTFPFNLLLGIPLYAAVARQVLG